MVQEGNRRPQELPYRLRIYESFCNFDYAGAMRCAHTPSLTLTSASMQHKCHCGHEEEAKFQRLKFSTKQRRPQA